MAPLTSVKSDGKQPGKYVEQVNYILQSAKQINISDACTDADIDAKIFEYLASRQEKIARLVITSEEFKTSKKIPNNVQIFSSYFVNEIKDLCIHSTLKMILLPGDLSNYVVKFATYHLHYKEKFGIIESTYNLFLFRPAQIPRIIESIYTPFFL